MERWCTQCDPAIPYLCRNISDRVGENAAVNGIRIEVQDQRERERERERETVW